MELEDRRSEELEECVVVVVVGFGGATTPELEPKLELMAKLTEGGAVLVAIGSTAFVVLLGGLDTIERGFDIMAEVDATELEVGGTVLTGSPAGLLAAALLLPGSGAAPVTALK